MRIRTGYSFRHAYGAIKDVMSRLVEIGWKVAPITDRLSTYGYVRWTKEAEKAGLRPIYGVELPVIVGEGEKRPTADWWTFFATDSLKPINRLIYDATSMPGKFPALKLKHAISFWDDCMIFIGSATDPQLVDENINMLVSPSTSLRQYKRSMHLPHLASSDNVYPRENDLETYRVALGFRSTTQTYPQHIMSDAELDAFLKANLSLNVVSGAPQFMITEQCTAKLHKAKLLKPKVDKTLRQLCEEGAAKLRVNLKDEVYAARLDRELALIKQKEYEDYFFIIADMVNWAKARMVVGPARGSSCGSLVCYLLGITAIEPIPYKLLFERFIDVNRADLPDIDIDFSDKWRHRVFEYAENKYGRDHVARLGTVMNFKPRSALKQTAAALRVPSWKLAGVLDNIIERSSGDTRALQAVEDTLQDTPTGKKLLADHPQMRIAGRLEAHPVGASQHAAGIVLTQTPIIDYVAIDARTGSTMCDKKDAEDLNLLKIDALGLTQLSIFERAMELIGVDPVSGWLEKITLDDPKSLDVINQGHFAGVFQFNGQALQNICRSVEVSSIDDIITITALARPGPFASGGTTHWIKRKTNKEAVSYPHALFEPYLKDTLGVVCYQEQVMEIGRNIGDLSWDDVTALRKAMSKSLGKEYFDQFGDRWKTAAEKKGIDRLVLDQTWDDLCAYGSWAFNRSHAVAYGIVSYWCCWFKAHYPLEFAAATLDAESDPMRQIAMLRELQDEGINYKAVDIEHSTDRWEPIKKRNLLVGPLTNIKGIGPKTVAEILECRRTKTEIRPALLKRMQHAATSIDSLYPVADRIKQLHPDLRQVNITTEPVAIARVKPGWEGDVMIIGVANRINPKNENEEINVAKRGGKRYTGPEISLAMFFEDDTDIIYCKVDRFKFEKLGKPIVERGKAGKAIYAVKGTVPSGFRMIQVNNIRYLGDME